MNIWYVNKELKNNIIIAAKFSKLNGPKLPCREIMQAFGRSLIESQVMNAINLLLQHDLFLLQSNVNERSLSHKLTEYLQGEFQGWHVDCEYNRDHDLTKRRVRVRSCNIIKDADELSRMSIVLLKYLTAMTNVLGIQDLLRMVGSHSNSIQLPSLSLTDACRSAP